MITRESNPQRIIIWKIQPPPFLPLNDVPPITYGTLPDGWEQEIPKREVPPPLSDGGIYYVSGIPRVGPNIKLCFLVSGENITPYLGKTQGKDLCDAE
jgi:hypothetical protein